MATAARPKPRSKTTANVFEGQELGLWLEAEKWLKKHHKVHHREIDLYLSLLRDKERTISWKEWLRRVEDRYSDYRAAEWIAAGEKEPFLLWKRIADVSVGIRFESVAGIELHETRKNDPVFRANVSDTGFRSLSFRGPAVKLEDVIVERMGEYREEQAKEARRNRRVRPLRKSVGKSPTPVFPTNRPKRTEDLDREINEFVEARTGIKNAIDRKRDGPPGGALVVSARAGDLETPLDAAERRQLATLEKTIERNAGAVFEFGRALREIRDGRLYRATHSSFEMYCADRWGISKSDGHRQIQAATLFEAAQPIAAKLGIALTCESQMRPLARVEAGDLPDVLKKAARLVPKAADGTRRITAEVLTRAVREETMSPDDLKRAAERKREAKASTQYSVPSTQSVANTQSVEPLQEEPAETPVGTSPAVVEVAPTGTAAALQRADSWVTCPTYVEFLEAGVEDQHEWKGKRPVWAYDLHVLKIAVKKLIEERGSDMDFCLQLGWVLSDLAIDARAHQTLIQAAIAAAIAVTREASEMGEVTNHHDP